MSARHPAAAVTVEPARIPGDLDAIRALFREYEAWLGENLCFQSFEDELAGLPGRYAPPAGRLLVARAGGEAVGCVALRALDERICEMKRLYVRPAWQGVGLGRRLVETLLAEARVAGYRGMRLDTLPKMDRAQRLYRALGFRDTAPYYANPIPGAVYLERRLVAS